MRSGSASGGRAVPHRAVPGALPYPRRSARACPGHHHCRQRGEQGPATAPTHSGPSPVRHQGPRRERRACGNDQPGQDQRHEVGDHRGVGTGQLHHARRSDVPARRVEAGTREVVVHAREEQGRRATGIEDVAQCIEVEDGVPRLRNPVDGTTASQRERTHQRRDDHPPEEDATAAVGGRPRERFRVPHHRRRKATRLRSRPRSGGGRSTVARARRKARPVPPRRRGSPSSPVRPEQQGQTTHTKGRQQRRARGEHHDEDDEQDGQGIHPSSSRDVQVTHTVRHSRTDREPTHDSTARRGIRQILVFSGTMRRGPAPSLYATPAAGRLSEEPQTSGPDVGTASSRRPTSGGSVRSPCAESGWCPRRSG